MSIKVIIIEADPNYRALLSQHVSTHWNAAKVTEYDPAEAGALSDDFAGAGNDLVLLGDPLGEHSGLEWLRGFKSIRNFPPFVVVADGDERAIVGAIKAGAFDYISRDRLKHDVLVGMLEDASSRQHPRSIRVPVASTASSTYRASSVTTSNRRSRAARSRRSISRRTVSQANR